MPDQYGPYRKFKYNRLSLTKKLEKAEKALDKHCKKSKYGEFDGDTWQEETRHLQGIIWGLKLASDIMDK